MKNKFVNVKEMLLGIHGVELDNEIVITDGEGFFKLKCYEDGGNNCPSFSHGTAHRGTLFRIEPLTKEEMDYMWKKDKGVDDTTIRKNIRWTLDCINDTND